MYLIDVVLYVYEHNIGKLKAKSQFSSFSRQIKWWNKE